MTKRIMAAIHNETLSNGKTMDYYLSGELEQAHGKEIFAGRLEIWPRGEKTAFSPVRLKTYTWDSGLSPDAVVEQAIDAIFDWPKLKPVLEENFNAEPDSTPLQRQEEYFQEWYKKTSKELAKKRFELYK